MARWTASAKWAAGTALDGERDMPLALRLSEGLGVAGSAVTVIAFPTLDRALARARGTSGSHTRN